MGEREGEENDGESAGPSDSVPPPPEESTTIDLSLAGALTPEELLQLGEDPLDAPVDEPLDAPVEEPLDALVEEPLDAPVEEERTVAEPVPMDLIAAPPVGSLSVPSIEQPPEQEDRTVMEPVRLDLIAEPPPNIDPDATFKLPPERSEIIVLPGRSTTTTILLIVSGVAVLAALVTIGIIFGSSSWKSSTGLTVGGAGASRATDAGADGTSSVAVVETPDSAAESLDAGGADTATPDADARDAAAGDATVEDAGFVIEDPEIPAAIERMRPRARARRARAQRRAALRLHGRMRYDRAEEAWRRALVFQPDSPHTHAGLARTLRALERDDEADAWQARADAASEMTRRPRRRRRR